MPEQEPDDKNNRETAQKTMSKTLFYWMTLGGCILLIFATGPMVKRLGLELSEEMGEKVTGAFVAVYFCLCVSLFLWSVRKIEPEH